MSRIKGVGGIGRRRAIFPPLVHTPIRHPLTFRRVLEILRKPGDAVANVVHDISFGGRPGETVIDSFVEGLRGDGVKPEKVADKMLTAMDIKDPSPAMKFFTRTAVSIGTDPLTYVPFSLPLKMAKKATLAIPGVRKGLELLKNTAPFRVPARALGKAFNPMHDVPKILRSATQKGRFLTMGLSDDAIKVVKDDLVKPYTALPLVDRRLVLEAIEHTPADGSFHSGLLKAAGNLNRAGLAVSINKPVQDVIRKAQTIGKKIEELEKKAGIDYERMESAGYILHYINPKYHHLINRLHPDTAIFGVKSLMNEKHKSMLRRSTWYLDVPKEGLATLERLRPGTLKKMGLSTPTKIRLSESKIDPKMISQYEEFTNAIKEIGVETESRLRAKGLLGTWKNYTVREINQAAAEGKLELLYDPIKKEAVKVKDFMVEDVPTLLAIRGVRAARAIGNRQYVDEVIDIARKSGLAYDDIKDVKDLGMKVEKSRFVETVLKKDIWFDREIANYLDRMETIMQSPHELTEALSYFDRVQNIWKWWTLVPIPSYHVRNMLGNTWNNYLAGVSPKAYKIAGELMAGKKGIIEGTDITYDVLRSEIAKWGVAGRGQTAIETSMKQLKSQLYGSFGNRVASIGEMNENLFRLANFADGFVLKKMSGAEARERVAKYLFDYQDLTPFERSTLRRVFPFYTWTRKNVPLQLENFVKQTYKYTGLERTLYALEKDVPSPEFIPDTIKERNPVFIGNEVDGTARAFLVSGWLPAYDLQLLLGGYGNTLASMLTPIAKAPIEFFHNYSIFLKRALERYPGQTMSFVGGHIPNKWVNLIRNLRVINEADKLNPGMIFGGEGVPGIFGVSREQRVEPHFAARLLNFFTGIRITPIEIKIMKRQYLQNLQNNIIYIRGQLEVARKTKQTHNIPIIEEHLKKYGRRFKEVQNLPPFVR